MKACLKEIKCIEVARKLRLRVVRRKIAGCIIDNADIFPPVFTGWKKQKPLVVILRLVLSLILAPILILLFIIKTSHDILFDREGVYNVIKELKGICHFDYQVSEIKSFAQLWNQKGLRNGHTSDYTGYTVEEQRRCIYKWFEILYVQPGNPDFLGRQIVVPHLSDLIRRLSDERAESLKRMNLQNFDGHITIRWESLEETELPEEIDKQFGCYLR